MKKITFNKKNYYYNPFNGKIYDVETNSNRALDELLKNNKIIDFFRYNDFSEIYNLKKIFQLDKAYEYNLNFYAQLTKFEKSLNNPDVLENNLNQISILTISVTQNCNLKCNYCFYNKCNKENGNYSKQKIKFSTIVGAIDFYMRRVKKGSKPAINFYGGEPILEFILIKKSIKYIRKKYGNKIIITITSNGTLLDIDKIKFFENNNVVLAISFDGPKKNHDKNRIYLNGKGTHNDIYKIIKTLNSKFKNYYKKYIGFSTVIDPEINIKNFCNYFRLNNDLFKENLFKVVFENFYRTPARESLKNNNLLKKILKQYKEYIHHSTQNFNILNFVLKKDLEDLIRPQKKINFLSRLCFPGQARMFVDYKGDIYICESMDHSIIIGNINNGYNFPLIKEFVIEYLKFVKKHCLNCWVSRLCKLCYVHAISKNNFSEDIFLKSCSNYKKYIQELIIFILCIEKENDLEKLKKILFHKENEIK